jgi:hypothetical protein
MGDNLLREMDQDERERLRRRATNLTRLRDQILRQDEILKDVQPRTQSWQGASESIMAVIRHLFDELREVLPEKNISFEDNNDIDGLRSQLSSVYGKVEHAIAAVFSSLGEPAPSPKNVSLEKTGDLTTIGAAEPMAQPPKVDNSLKIANITARQAIIVAVITSVAGLLGAYIGNQQKKTDTTEHRIKFNAVQAGEPGAVRVVFEVNGQPYSYPSRVVWADVSQQMSPESFPLPSGLQSFSIHVFAYFRNDAGGVVHRFETQEAKTFPLSGLPTRSRVRRHTGKRREFLLPNPL